ncbi:sensor histidine kinase [Rhodobacter calidifons]|uniref:histidine kinase n=1 Tax=Rhodobacter calidifons TaxID=2715277 RepID=A0ABX0G4F4_9RHOB|nr:sensor histidine kinase [Rhodobacter calidifons]NHB76009.1 sensor histidine kinase [Rhodobacter calidifons]
MIGGPGKLWPRLWPRSSLGTRLGATLLLALMPLGLLSIVQTRDALAQLDATTLEGVGGAAVQSVRPQVELIRQAQVSARALAAILSREGPEGPACADWVRSLARDIPQATLIAYIPLDGLMTCSSNGDVFDFKDNPRFQEMIATPLPKLIYNPAGPVSGMAIVGAAHPVFTPSGAPRGFVTISLNYAAVAPDAYVDSVASWHPTYLATFQADGSLLLASDPGLAPESAIPGGISRERLADLAGKPTFVATPQGRRILSVVGVTDGLLLVSVWENRDAEIWSRASSLTPYLLPALTWIAALVAASFASSRLVVRHVRALARSMDDYTATRNRVQIPDLDGAPTEIQRLHATYEELIRTIEQEEAELQNLLIDKDILLREVDHRSGNSLQIIASVMRMYRREATDPGLRQVLDSLINRVIALSSTHTSLYAVSGRQDIAMDMVLTNVVRRLKEIHGVGLGVASKDFQPVQMDAQSAVPLALALAEAVGCFFSRPGLGERAVSVSLSESRGMVRLQVEGPVVPELLPDATSGLTALPQRMLRQFAAQLGGAVVLRQDGDRVRVDLHFPVARPEAG